ncbi:type IV pilus biogenesis/stability protein PilW [Sphaerotilus uruguayifluvii]|uniref:Type IV pilus assembly protein PilF n=1 Tax=Sphaerotilus uruguayifluvii TaxID=2735897 RepID=A0ABX2G506_9BURK|nr:type IV pilus biogenesis/stability protein PilW [Leptothrix sp. C29]NRT57134.1 type IV pilus assembly protein PilF [Leptothrix sp. C29]
MLKNPAWLTLLVLLGAGSLGGCVAGPSAPVPMGTETGGAPLAVAQVAQAPAGARRDLTTASDETDQDRRVRIRTELAGAYFGQGQLPTALDEIKRALAVDPQNVPALTLRGMIYAAMGEFDLGEASLREALRLRPDDGDTLHNYGWFLCQRRRFPEARKQFEAAMAVPQYREQARTLLAAGLCEARAGDLQTAQLILQRSFDLEPGNPVTTFNLADVLMRRGELERAFLYVQRLNQTPELVRAQTLWLAIRIQQRRNLPASVEELGSQLRTRFPNSREAAAFEQGQFDE